MIKIIDNMGFVKDVTPTVFPDTTKLLKVDAEIGDDYDIVWLYDNDEELFQVIAITKHLQAKGFGVNLRMPYIPNARMDRVKSANEVFTLKYFAHVINWLGFKNVYVANPEEAKIQRISAAGSSRNDNNRISSRFVEDGSYLRLKTLSLAYNLPKKWLSPVGLDWVQVYGNIQNVFTITGYDGYDPELGSIGQSVLLQGLDNGRYPSQRIYTLGLKVRF